MVYQYELEVRFHNDTANQAQQYDFYEFVRVYKPATVGHKAKETSTLYISSESELTRDGLARLLGENIPIISFKRVE